MAKKDPKAPATLEEALEVITKQNEQIANLESENAELSQLLAEAREHPAGHSVPEFTFEKKKYRVTAGKFNFDGKIHSAAELIENKELQAQLIQLGVGFIEEVTE